MEKEKRQPPTRYRKEKKVPLFERKVLPIITIGLLGALALLTTINIALNTRYEKLVMAAESTRVHNAQGTATQQGGVLDIGPGVSEDYLSRLTKVWFQNESEGGNVQDLSIGYCTLAIESVALIQDPNYDGTLVETKGITVDHCVDGDDTTVIYLAQNGSSFAGKIIDVEIIGETVDEDSPVRVTSLSTESALGAAQQFANIATPLILNFTPDLHSGDSVTVCGFPSAVQPNLDATLYCFHALYTAYNDTDFLTVFGVDFTGGISGAPGVKGDGAVVGVVAGSDAIEVNDKGYLLELSP